VTGRAAADAPAPAALEDNQGNIWSLALSPDGTRLGVGMKYPGAGPDTHAVNLWDVRTGKLLRVLSEKHRPADSLVFSPDGKRLFHRRHYRTQVFIHDVDTGKEMPSFTGHKTVQVNGVAISPDGKLAASCDDKGDVLLWNPDTLEVKRVLHLDPPHPDPKGSHAIREVLFTPDGRHLLTRNSDGTVYVVRLTPWETKTSAAPTAPAEGFVSLFNGKELTGWATVQGGAGNWKVVDGAVTCVGDQSYLYSLRDDYTDFHLKVEAKINETGNSGVFFRAGKRAGIPAGPEAQINIKGDAYQTGGLHGLVKAATPPNTPDAWFTMEIIAEGNAFASSSMVSKPSIIRTWLASGPKAMSPCNTGPPAPTFTSARSKSRNSRNRARPP
jgi:hypothetical protein